MERVVTFHPATVLDIGAGTGGSCIPIARSGINVTAVEPDAGMSDQLRTATTDLPVSVVHGGWPDVSDQLGMFDVVTATHVIHNIHDAIPFIQAMERHAKRAVVIQEFLVHPWAHLGPYYLALHDLERPTGPTIEDLVALVEEAAGQTPNVEHWEGERPTVYLDWDELLGFYGRRLVLPVDRRDELRELLEVDFHETGDGVQERNPRKGKATVWWEPS